MLSNRRGRWARHTAPPPPPPEGTQTTHMSPFSCPEILQPATVRYIPQLITESVRPLCTGNPLGTLSQASVREAAVRRLDARPFESQKHAELLEGVKNEIDRLVSVAKL